MGSMADKLAAALAVSTPRPKKPHNVANPQDATGCCAAIRRAIRKGELDAVDVWVCPKCGMEWKPRNIEGVRYWECQPVIMLWK